MGSKDPNVVLRSGYPYVRHSLSGFAALGRAVAAGAEAGAVEAAGAVLLAGCVAGEVWAFACAVPAIMHRIVKTVRTGH